MDNPIIDLIHLHASVRHYKPDRIPNSVIETFVEAGQRASTSSNMQAYSVVAVTEAGKRQRLADLCGNQQFIAEAPVFLAWCADLARPRPGLPAPRLHTGYQLHRELPCCCGGHSPSCSEHRPGSRVHGTGHLLHWFYS